MTIQEILEIMLAVIETLIANCPEPEVERRLARLRNPRAIDWARFNLGLRREGLNREERREANRLARELNSEASDADLRQLVESATAKAT